MSNEFQFKPTALSEEINKKLFIKRLPEWMQSSEQIQVYCDEVIQQWFTPEEQNLVDGYIGQRGSPAAAGKVFLHEMNVSRQEYQLSPAYVSRNDDGSVRSTQFYPDTVGYLKHYGANVSNESRLMDSYFYSWTPPINPNKLYNFSSYVWDLQNDYGIQPDYVVMERGSLNGNTWSLQNFWYTLGDLLPDGSILTEELSQGSRFARALSPIIEYNKNIELLNYGTLFRGVVDYFSDQLKPEDIVQRRVSDDIRVDGYILKTGDRILFTSIGNPGENNRIYKVYTDRMADGSVVYGLVLDEDEESTLRPSGEPLIGDVVLIRSGNNYANKSFYWTGKVWKQAQVKNGINSFPKFALYDQRGVALNDPVKYPNSDFNGSELFGLKINYSFPVDKTFGVHVELNSLNYYVFENFLQTKRYSYLKSTTKTDINGFYFYNVINENGNSLKTDWVRSKQKSKQFVNQVPEIVKYSMFRIFNTIHDMNIFTGTIEGMYAYVVENDQNYRFFKDDSSTYSTWHEISTDIIQSDVFESTFVLAQKVDSNNSNDEIEVILDGEIIKNDIIYNKDNTGTITSVTLGSSHKLNFDTVLDIRTYSEKNIPDLTLGAYEIPINLKNNPYNEKVDFIDQSEYSLHFNDIITKNITVGDVNGNNNYEERLRAGLVDNSVGVYIIQNESSLLPLMIHTANDNLSIFESIMYVKRESFRFKNKFNTKMVSLYNENPSSFVGKSAIELVNTILQEINIGKDSTFPFYNSKVGSTSDVPNTFIPPTPEFLGISKPYRPEKATPVFMGSKLGIYNIDCSGLLSKAYHVINGVDKMDDVIFELESRIYNSIDESFKNVDYTPTLNSETLNPSAYFNSTEYSNDEYQQLLLRGYVNFIATNGIDGTMHDYNPENWMTWNFSAANYIVNGASTEQKAKGSWRAIYTDMFGTYRPYSHPWEMFGFTQRPDWFNDEYKPTRIRTGTGDNDFMFVYEALVKNENGDLVPSGLWDINGTIGDASTGTIVSGARAGTYAKYKRFGTQPFKLTPTGDMVGTEIVYKIELISPIDLGMITNNIEKRAEPWTYGDMGDTEFTYMNTNLFAYDRILALLRAKPAQFMNYFYDSKNSVLKTIVTNNIQFVFKDTDTRLDLNSNTLVSTENNKVQLGYCSWVSDYLINQNKDVSKNYGDVLRSSKINVGHRIGGFTKDNQLTFSSDSFGLLSNESQHIGLVRSSTIEEGVYSSLKITWTGDGYSIQGYDLINPFLQYIEPNKTGKRNTISIDKRSVVHYNEYKNKISSYAYGTLLKSFQEVYTFICSYGKYLESTGWIYEDVTENAEILDWDLVAREFVQWSSTNLKKGDFISISPSSKVSKFVADFGTVESVAQYSGGVWSILDDQNVGIRPDELDTTRIGNVYSIRLHEESDKRMALIRLNIRSYEHAIIFDDRTIFGDNIYIPKYGSIHEMFKMYGYITAKWNGRLEAPGFMILENGTLPNFEKLVNDFNLYDDNDFPVDNSTIRDISNHLIGYQTRNYIRQMITNESSQVDFYKGFIKEKGTKQSFEKVLRVSKTYNTENYKALEEWAFKVGTYGNVDGKKNLQFQMLNDEFKQEPQLFVFNEKSDKGNHNSIVQYYGAKGDDSRWITRPNGSFSFPMRTGKNVNFAIPDIGPVTLDEVSFSTTNFETVYSARSSYVRTYNKQPTSVWMYHDVDTHWNIYNIVNTNLKLLKIEPIITDDNDISGNYCKLTLSANHGLVDGDYIYFVDSTDFMPDGLRVEAQYFYSADDANQLTIPLNVQAVINFTDNQPTMYRYVSRFSTVQDKESYVNNKYKFEAPESTLFDKPSTYNSQTNVTEMYLNVYDPINGVIPGSLLSEITYINTYDPALYNSEVNTIEAWGSEQVGKVWWNTTSAYYMDYTRPILDQNGNIDEEKTLEYKRFNWGKLLPESSIDMYEWVKSPVPPYEYETYCYEQSKLNKSSTAWVPSGTADQEFYSQFREYDEVTNGYKMFYYFWVKNAIYLPRLNYRNKSCNEIARSITNPMNLNVPWFAPISSNAFIISGIENEITDDKSILTIQYQMDNTEVIKHEQYQLCQEGLDYNFNPVVWNTLFNSLTSQELINSNYVELKYPKNDLGCEPNKTWFMDVLEARRTFVDSANTIFKSINVTSNSVAMNEIFNVTTTELNPNSVNFKVLNLNNELVISPSVNKFSENDAVIVNSTGVLPKPLTNIDVYFVHIDDSGYIRLMRSPSTSSTSVTINILDQGEGIHSIIKQEDYISTLSTSLDMTKYWSYTDWYSNGYSEKTFFTEEQSIDVANTKNYQNGDVIKVTDSDGVWTLYVKTFSRNQVLWQAVARNNSTVKLNSSLYTGYNQYDSNGNPTEYEKNVRLALMLFKNAFNTLQSRLVFDMVKYVHTEQNVVDWVFKTSYIYVIGLEQALQRDYLEKDDLINQIVAYFEEVKPYRTKIRSQIEQKTSDEDEVNGVVNDLDPNGYMYINGAWVKVQKDIWDEEYAEYDNSLKKWVIKGSLPSDFKTPNRRFQEADTILQFDNTECVPSNSLLNKIDMENIYKKYQSISKDTLINTERYKLQRYNYTLPVIKTSNIESQVKSNLVSIYPFLSDSLSLGLSDFVQVGYQYFINDLSGTEQYNSDVQKYYNSALSSDSTYNEALQYSNYNTLANRIKLYNPNKSNNEISDEVNCPFKGRVISDNPNTRLPFGYSASTDYNYGYIGKGKEVLDKFISLTKSKNPTYTDEQVDAYLRYEYGIYPWSKDYSTNGVNYTDALYVLTSIRNNYNPDSIDHFELSKQILSNPTLDTLCFIMIPRKFVKIYNSTTGTYLDVPMEQGLEEFMEDQMIINNDVVYVSDTALDDLPLDENSMLYSDYKEVISGINNAEYFNDMNSFDNLGFESQTKSIQYVATDVVSEIQDPYFFSINSLNPNGTDMAQIRFTIDGYNYDDNTHVSLREGSNFQIEGCVVLNPYNRTEALVSIPRYADAINYMSKDIIQKNKIKYIHNVSEVTDTAGSIVVPNHDFSVGDKIAIFTPEASDLDVQNRDGTWRTILSVNNIKDANNRPLILPISSVLGDTITVAGLTFDNVYNPDDTTLLNPSLKIGLNVMRVTSFRDAEFTQGSTKLYTTHRTYRFDALDYDLYYDRQVTQSSYLNYPSKADLDSWYSTNETEINVDGVEIDHGYYLPIYGAGVLSERVRTKVLENIQITVIEYNTSEINPVLDNGTWKYNSSLIDNVYLSTFNAHVNCIFGSTDLSSTFKLQTPKFIEPCTINNGTITSTNLAKSDLILISNSIVDVINKPYFISSVHCSTDIYYAPNTTHTATGMILGKEIDMHIIGNNYFTYEPGLFSTGYVISPTEIGTIL